MSLDFLPTAALVAIPVGAVGSIILTLLAGRGNNSYLLMFLFIGWVSGPFMALLWANLASKRWSALTQTTVYLVTLLVTLVTLAIFTHDVLRPRAAQAAFVFIMVPPASCLLSGIVIAAAALVSRKRSS